jgi:hypothetical protein
MAANLLLGYAEIPLRASSVTLSQTEDAKYPYSNLFGGNKTDRFALASAFSGNLRATFLNASGPCDFLYVGRARLLQKNKVASLSLKGNTSNTYATAATLLNNTSFASQTFYGPAEDDYIATFSPGSSSTYTHWWVDYTSSAASKFPHANLFFGKAFDPGIDPNDVLRFSRTATLGTKIRATYAFNLRWRGMTYAKAVEFYEKFSLNRRHTPVVLFTTSYHDILFGHRVLFGRITEVDMPPRITDYCDVTARFEEMV